MKKAKEAKKNMIPDPGALEGIPAHNPHEEFAPRKMPLLRSAEAVRNNPV